MKRLLILAALLVVPCTANAEGFWSMSPRTGFTYGQFNGNFGWSMTGGQFSGYYGGGFYRQPTYYFGGYGNTFIQNNTNYGQIYNGYGRRW